MRKRVKEIEEFRELERKAEEVQNSPNSDLEVAIKRIAGGKWGPCSGQACIGVDYVLVEQKFAPIMVEMLKKCIKTFYGETLENLKNLCRIVNKHHFDRVRNLLEDPIVSDSVVYGGLWDEQNLMIEPTILVEPLLDSDLMCRNGYNGDDEYEYEDEDGFNWEKEMRKRVKKIEEFRELEKKAKEVQNRVDEEFKERGEDKDETEEEKRMRV